MAGADAACIGARRLEAGRALVTHSEHAIDHKRLENFRQSDARNVSVHGRTLISGRSTQV